MKVSRSIRLPIGKKSTGVYSFTYLIDLISIDLADVVGLRLGLLDHFKGDGGEDAVFPSLPAKFASHSPLATLRICIAAKFIVEAGCSAKARSTNVLPWVEEALILTRELTTFKLYNNCKTSTCSTLPAFSW